MEGEDLDPGKSPSPGLIGPVSMNSDVHQSQFEECCFCLIFSIKPFNQLSIVG